MRLWFPILAVGAFIFMTSELITDVPAVSLQFASDLEMTSISHVFLYFCLGIFIARYMRRRLELGAMGTFILSVSLCLTIGVLDEFHQMFVAGREAEFGDLLSDLIGGSLGASLAIALTRRLEISRGCQTEGEVQSGSLLGKVVTGAILVCFLCVSAIVVTGAVPSSFLALAAEGATAADCMLASYLQPDQEPMSNREKLAKQRHTLLSSTKEHFRSKTDSMGFLKVNGNMMGYTAELQIGKPLQTGPSADTGIPCQVPEARTPRTEKAKVAADSDSGKTKAGGIKRSLRAIVSNRLKPVNRKDHTRYLARFKNELAKLEIKEVRMVRYSDVYPPKVVLQEKIDYLRKKIHQISANAPQINVSVTTQDYLDALKQELADLEIKELHLIAYSDTYFEKALLRDKTAMLKRKISRTESGIDSAGTMHTEREPKAMSHSRHGSENPPAPVRLSSLSGPAQKSKKIGDRF